MVPYGNAAGGPCRTAAVVPAAAPGGADAELTVMARQVAAGVVVDGPLPSRMACILAIMRPMGRRTSYHKGY